MKRTDIKAGVVYAKQASAYGRPDPIVFLEDGAVTVYRANEYGDMAYTALENAKPRRDAVYGPAGYAVVVPNWKASTGDTLTAMRAIDPAAELPHFQSQKRAESGQYVPGNGDLRFGVLVNLGKVTGEYDAMVAAYEAQVTAERQRRVQADAVAKRARERATALRAAFDSLGFRAGCGASHGEGVSFSLDVAERLLAALRPATGEPSSASAIVRHLAVFHGIHWTDSGAVGLTLAQKAHFDAIDEHPESVNTDCLEYVPEAMSHEVARLAERNRTPARPYLAPGLAPASAIDRGAPGQVD